LNHGRFGGLFFALLGAEICTKCVRRMHGRIIVRSGLEWQNTGEQEV